MVQIVAPLTKRLGTEYFPHLSTPFHTFVEWLIHVDPVI